MSNMAFVLAQPQTDPASDLLNRNGGPSVGEPYLDVIESDMERTGTAWVATIELAGAVPSQTSSSGVFIEWDIMVDMDQSNKTGAWGEAANAAYRQLMVNGIGVDLMVRLAMNGTKSWVEQYLVSDQYWYNVGSAAISGNKVTLTIPLSIAQERLRFAENFDFTVLVRKYSVGGATNVLPPASTLQAFDKAPNEGHYAFIAGSIKYVPEFPAAQLLAAVILSITVLAHSLNKRREKSP